MKSTKYILTLGLLLLFSLLFSIDPWGSPTVLTGSMTIMAQVNISGQPAVNSDVLAAFVNVDGQDQLRGKGTIQVINNIAGCLLQTYTETNGETIIFRVWDESAQQIQNSTQSLLSEVNGSTGSWPDSLYLINADQIMIADPWLTPAALSGSMSVMAQVSINSLAAEAGDVLAAFVTVNSEEQLRGKANIVINNNIAGCLLQVFTETNAEQVTFKVWNYSDQLIFASTQILTSEVNGIIGTWPSNLYLINAGIVIPQVATPIFDPAPGTYTTTQNITISCATPDATIRYTTNGTEPTVSSLTYSAPFFIPQDSTTFIKAKAFKTDWIPSATATALYNITGSVATPVISPAAGTYTSDINVTMSCTTTGATIRYTTNGTDPTPTSAIYSVPINITSGNTTTVKAKAFKTDWIPSAIASAEYTATGMILTPYFNPTAGTYSTDQNININCVITGVDIRYTVDGTEPNESSTLYMSPIPVTAAATLKAKAYKTGWIESNTATAVYSFQVDTIYMSPLGGTYILPQTITIIPTTPGSEIYYTTDGSAPSDSSNLYTAPLTISETTTVKARAFRTGWTPSNITTSIYIITGTVATPSFSPVPGSYNEAIDVTIECETPAATIRYTLDSSEPTEASLLYNPEIPIHVTQSIVIKAKAFRTSWIPSSVATAEYIILVANNDNVDELLVPGIASCYPNPFVTETSIRVAVPKGQRLQDVSVYDVKGKLVRQLACVSSKHGIIDIKWNGRTDDGRKVSSGVYFVKCRIDNKTSIKKVSMLLN